MLLQEQLQVAAAVHSSRGMPSSSCRGLPGKSSRSEVLVTVGLLQGTSQQHGKHDLSAHDFQSN